MSPNKKQHTLVRLVALAAICPGVTSADAVQDWNAIMWTTTAAASREAPCGAVTVPR